MWSINANQLNSLAQLKTERNEFIMTEGTSSYTKVSSFIGSSILSESELLSHTRSILKLLINALFSTAAILSIISLIF